MNEEIKILIDSLRRGQFEDPTEKISLLSAALQESRADLTLMLSLIRAPQVPLRLAAIDASRGRTEPELLTELNPLTADPDTRVRVKLAEVLGSRTEKRLQPALHELLRDGDSDVREATLKSTAGRPEFFNAHVTCLKDSQWRVRFAAVEALDRQNTPKIFPALIASLHDADTDVAKRCAEIIEKCMDRWPEKLGEYLTTDIAFLSQTEKRLKQLDAQRYPKFLDEISKRTAPAVDPATLTRFGTDLTALALNGDLPHAYHLEETVESIVKLLQRERWRSIVLLGSAGTGKTALVHELVYELARPENGAWRVLRVSPADFMADTKYLGEWETKVRDLVQSIRKPRRVVLYIPNFSDLAAAGTWSKSDMSVASALAPYMDDGSIVVIGESTPEEYEKGLGRLPTLRRLLDKVLLTEVSVERTREIVTEVRNAAMSSLSDEVLTQLIEVGAQFLSHVSRPGNAVELVRAVIKEEEESGEPITFRNVLDCLSKSTGIPANLLDDAVPLHENQIREFFEKRIMGQPEAVTAVVDLVTLIKAGLTDPNKPFGVFLFVGPTGVGKTELARALAEFIFGDPARLKRFDMSEFANIEGFTRLIGSAHENGLLTDAVRQHPFSVVLLDEIEKSHLNVFDLCLQIFDAGRLTDGRGRLTDFRRTIVILTSNVGAKAGLPPAGFMFPEVGSAAGQVDKDRTFRELSRFFRPEFLNRLDRIINFRPLSLEVAEQIARREIDLVLQRSGIRRRDLVIDVDPAVVSLLVREGYSPYFGARPLKRTVERLLLLPLARAISSGSLRGRSMLRLSESNGRVQAIIARKAPVKQAATEEIRQPESLSDRVTKLQELYNALEPSIQRLADRKSELIVRSQTAEFVGNPELRAGTFTEIHNLDHFLDLHATIGRSVTTMAQHPSAEKLDSLLGDVEYVALVARCNDAGDLGDAIISISLVDRTGANQNALEKIAGMYQALAARRRMTADVLGEFYNTKHDKAYLLVSGLGAYGLLKNESGLHQIDLRYKERSSRNGRELIREDRELLKVEVHPVNGKTPKQFRGQVKTRVTTLRPVRDRLLKASLALTLFHEPSVRSIEFWTSGPQPDAMERGLSILYANVQGSLLNNEADTIVRQYDLGIAPKVKDHRTGRTTTRVKQVFKGDLSSFR